MRMCLDFLRTALDAHRVAVLVALIAYVFSAPSLGAEPTSAAAGGLPFANVIVRALVDGRASEPLPDLPMLRQAVVAMQQQAGDSGPIVVQAMRMQRFVQQARCGRVVFGMSQPSSHKAWPALGGELNICEDGLPPLRMCKDRPNILVPASSNCRDGSAPQDTTEVASAISAALNRGGLTVDQARQTSLSAGQKAQQSPASAATKARP